MDQTKLPEKVHKDYRRLTEELIAKGLSVSCMESCTCGMIASLITDTLGASAVFRGGINAYSNEAKIVYGVPEEIIARHGVYSKETAIGMAEAVRSRLKTDLSIGVTGSLCSVDEVNKDSIPGEVYIAVCCDRFNKAVKEMIPSGLSRFEAKLSVASAVCAVVEEMIKKISDTGNS